MSALDLAFTDLGLLSIAPGLGTEDEDTQIRLVGMRKIRLVDVALMDLVEEDFRF